MTVSLPQEKVESISKRCKDILSMQKMPIKNLAELLGTLPSTALAILLAPQYIGYFQKQQFHNICLKRDFKSKYL